MWYKVVLVGLGLSALVCCSKTDNQQVPYAPVNIQVNINNPQYIELNHPGGWIYMTGALKGLILYRKDQGVINAFDRLSPYPDEGGCVLVVDSSGVFAWDTCSASKWLLFDGVVNEGPAKRNLIQYQTSLNGSMLTISN